MGRTTDRTLGANGGGLIEVLLPLPQQPHAALADPNSFALCSRRCKVGGGGVVGEGWGLETPALQSLPVAPKNLRGILKRQHEPQ